MGQAERGAEELAERWEGISGFPGGEKKSGNERSAVSIWRGRRGRLETGEDDDRVVAMGGGRA